MLTTKKCLPLPKLDKNSKTAMKSNTDKAICIITSQPLNSHAGGLKQGWTMAKCLSENGLKIIFVNSGMGFGSSSEIMDGIVVITLKCPFIRFNPIKRLVFGSQLVFWLIQNRSKYIIAHFLGAGYHFVSFGILLGKVLGKRSIVKLTLLGTDDPKTIESIPFVGRPKLAILSKSAGVISTSPALTETCVKSGIQCPIFEIPNGVDTVHYHPADNRGNIKRKIGLDGELVASFVGGAIHRKGIDTLIGAWKYVVTKVPNAKLIIVGSTNKNCVYEQTYNDLLKDINKNGLGKNIVFVGQVQNVVEYLQASDLFVFPSRQEGLPNALLEAMACGLPCVASDLPGITDSLIEHGVSGYLVKDYNNRLAFAEQIIDVMNNQSSARNIGKAARENIMKDYSLINIASKYVELYNQLQVR